MPSETDASAQERRDLPDSDVRAQLERILASEVFSRSQQLRRFLTFIVQQRLAGQGHSLKEAVLAHELYGKGTDFDCGTDPVVRVDARRLRDKLREYSRANPIPSSSRCRRAATCPSSKRMPPHPPTRLLDSFFRGRHRRCRFRTSGERGSPPALWRSSLQRSPPRLPGAHSSFRWALQPSCSHWPHTLVWRGRRRCPRTATSSPSRGRATPRLVQRTSTSRPSRMKRFDD